MSGITKKGISHRRVHFWLIVVIVIFSGTVVFTTFRLTKSFTRVREAAKQHSELQDAAHDLMNASDYLTEKVQRFTATGDRQFLDQYFTEAFETNRRENALSKMNADDIYVQNAIGDFSKGLYNGNMSVITIDRDGNTEEWNGSCIDGSFNQIVNTHVDKNGKIPVLQNTEDEKEYHMYKSINDAKRNMEKILKQEKNDDIINESIIEPENDF